MNSKCFLILLTLPFALIGQSDEVHCTETSPCKGLMKDYELLSGSDRHNFIAKTEIAVESAIEKYSSMNDKNRLTQAKQIKSCVEFLKKFSNYVDSLKKTQPILDAIDSVEAPDFASPANINKKPNTFFRDLPKEQAWRLAECKPCQIIRQMFQKKDGTFDNAKANEMKKDVGYLYNNSFQTIKVERIAYKDWFGRLEYKDVTTSTQTPLNQLVPMHVHNKALLIEKCLLALEAQESLIKRSQCIESYFQEDVNSQNKEIK